MLGTPSRAPSSEKTLHIREQPSRAKSPAFTLCYGLQLCQTADASGMETFGIMAVEVLNVDLPRLRRNVVYGLLFSVRAVWTLSHGSIICDWPLQKCTRAASNRQLGKFRSAQVWSALDRLSIAVRTGTGIFPIAESPSWQVLCCSSSFHTSLEQQGGAGKIVGLSPFCRPPA